MRARQNAKIDELKRALIEAGFCTVLEQAKALGLSRSSAWAVLKAKHKSNGLSLPIIKRILDSPQLPQKAHNIILEYVRERLAGAYGHPSHRLNIFRTKLAAAGCIIAPHVEAPDNINCPNTEEPVFSIASE